jgi:hypothetical protein
MKFRDDFTGFGPSLILDGESAEQFSSGDDIENCLSFGCSDGRQLINF